jgi:hypothetical protein
MLPPASKLPATIANRTQGAIVWKNVELVQPCAAPHRRWNGMLRESNPGWQVLRTAISAAINSPFRYQFAVSPSCNGITESV